MKRPPVLYAGGRLPLSVCFLAQGADVTGQHESHAEQMVTKKNEYRIFRPGEGNLTRKTQSPQNPHTKILLKEKPDVTN
jgi:hypothetical protein